MKKGPVTKVGKQYEVTGNDVFAWTGYKKPSGNNPHHRGASVGAPAFSLTGLKITVTELVLRVEEGNLTGNPGEYAPFEIVKATVEGKKGEYYVWVVYEGELKVWSDNNTEESDSTAPIQPEKKGPQNPEDFFVAAGKTVVASSKEIEKGGGGDTELPDKEFVVTIADQNGNIQNSNCRLILIDDTLQEHPVELKNGAGGIDGLAAGTYTVVVDNTPEEKRAAEDAAIETVASNDAGLNILNPKYIRKGWVYQAATPADKDVPLIDNQSYETSWPKRVVDGAQSADDDFYRGVVDSDTVELPPEPTPQKVVGNLLNQGLFIIDQVLQFAKDLVSPETFNVAAKVIREKSTSPELFSWLAEKSQNYAQVMSGQIVYPGGPGYAQVPVGSFEPGKLLAANRDSDVASDAYTSPVIYARSHTANSEEKPEVKQISWEVPPSDSRDKKLLYFDHLVTNKPVPLLGVRYKDKGESIDIKIELKSPLNSESYMVSLAFWKINMLSEGNINRILINRARQQKNKRENSGKEFLIKRQFVIEKNKDNPSTKQYKVSVEKSEFYSICEKLDVEANKSLLGVAVALPNKEAKNWPSSESFAYPLLQHIIIFLPGLFGSRIFVDNEITGEFGEEAWFTINQSGQKEIELLECDADGKPLRPAIEEKLVVFEKIGGIVPIYSTKSGVQSADFYSYPKVYLPGNTQRIDHLIYADAPYDWRLPMSDSVSNQVFKDFPFLEHVYQQVERAYHAGMAKAFMADDQIVLSGHSTGGVMMQGLLSLKDLKFFGNSNISFAKKVKAAFYINAPTLGAPKAEILRLTGKEGGSLEKPIPSGPMFQISSNLPVAYILAPSTGYEKVAGGEWRRDYKASVPVDKQKERTEKILSKYAVGIWPKQPYSSTYEPLSETRDPILYNSKLAAMAEDYFNLWAKNYTKDVPSYIFHFSCLETVSGFSSKVLSELKEDPDTAKKIDKYVKAVQSYNNTYAGKIIPNAPHYGGYDSPKYPTLNFSLFEYDAVRSKQLKGLLDQRSYSGLQDFFVETQIINSVSEISNIRMYTIVPGKLWHVYDFHDDTLKTQAFHVQIIELLPSGRLRSFIVGNLDGYTKKVIVEPFHSDHVQPETKNFGDSTVPHVSQLGLWYMLSKDSTLKSRNDAPYSHTNIHIFKPTPENEAGSHMQGSNPRWVWDRVVSVLQKRERDIVNSAKVNCPDIVAGAERSTIDLDPGSEESPGLFSALLYDNSGVLLSAGTKVTVNESGGGVIGDYYLRSPGLLEIESLTKGQYTISDIVPPSAGA